MPLEPTYIQLQMIKVIDMGEDEYNPPITIGRPFFSTVKAIIYIGTREVHMHFPSEKKTTQPQPEEANHQGRMGRIWRRSCKVWKHTAWTELSWGDRSTESGVEREDSYTRRGGAAGTIDYAIQRIPGRLRKRRVPFKGLKNTNALPRGKLGSYLFPFNYLK